MKFIETKLESAYLIESERLGDERGFFARTFCREEFEAHGLNPNVAQCNIPEGLAHGFQALVDNCEVQYFMLEFYSPEHSLGVRWNDPFLNIKWPIENSILSKKDKNWPQMKQI